MSATIELLRAVKRRHGLTTDYQLHKYLGVSKQAVSAYMAGDVALGDDIAVRVAKELEIDAAAVLAAVAAERTKSEPARKALRDAVKRLGGIAAGVVAAVGLAGAPSPAPAQGANEAPGYYVNWRRRRPKGGGMARIALQLLGLSRPGNVPA